MITNERANLLSKILESDIENAKILLNHQVDEALHQINNLGYDFTSEELVAYGKILTKSLTQNNELDLESLDYVSGGVSLPIMPLKIDIGGKTIGGIW